MIDRKKFIMPTRISFFFFLCLMMAREKHIMTLHLTHGYFWASFFFVRKMFLLDKKKSSFYHRQFFFLLFRVNWQVSKRNGGRNCAEDSLKSFNSILRLRRERSIYFHSRIIDILKILFRFIHHVAADVACQTSIFDCLTKCQNGFR